VSAQRAGQQASATPPVDAAAIGRAAEVLAAGGLVAFPTETVYGLGADADDVGAVRTIFAAKGRPADHPLIVHVLDAAAIDAWSAQVPEAARHLAQAFWPGPLTLVLPRAARAHDALTGGQRSVGLRCPSHPWAQALLRAFAARRGDAAAALAAPSANRFGRISPTTAAHVRADLGEKPAGRVDMILDGGACPVGIESTIVDLTGAVVRLLRRGSITRRDLERVLGAAVPDAGADAPRASGGLKSHYAPRAPLEVVPPGRLPARINELRGERVAVLAPAAALLDWPAAVVLRLVAPADAAGYARRLYALLHELDDCGAARILVAEPPAGEDWEAARDRLRRAAAAAGDPDDVP
jgi:L-threonylcarbamoyladenylate synthase